MPRPPMARTRRPEISAITTKRTTYGLAPNQCFYETAKFYELWEERHGERFVRMCRFELKRVIWVSLKTTDEHKEDAP